MIDASEVADWLNLVQAGWPRNGAELSNNALRRSAAAALTLLAVHHRLQRAGRALDPATQKELDDLPPELWGHVLDYALAETEPDLQATIRERQQQDNEPDLETVELLDIENAADMLRALRDLRDAHGALEQKLSGDAERTDRLQVLGEKLATIDKLLRNECLHWFTCLTGVWLLKNWRHDLPKDRAPEDTRSLPWWLDGRIERAAEIENVELDRLWLRLQQWANATEHRAEIEAAPDGDLSMRVADFPEATFTLSQPDENGEHRLVVQLNDPAAKILGLCAAPSAVRKIFVTTFEVERAANNAAEQGEQFERLAASGPSGHLDHPGLILLKSSSWCRVFTNPRREWNTQGVNLTLCFQRPTKFAYRMRNADGSEISDEAATKPPVDLRGEHKCTLCFPPHDLDCRDGFGLDIQTRDVAWPPSQPEKSDLVEFIPLANGSGEVAEFLIQATQLKRVREKDKKENAEAGEAFEWHLFVARQPEGEPFLESPRQMRRTDFSETCDLHYRAIFRYCRGRLRSENAAHDGTQTVFLTAFRKARFIPKGAMRSWLTRVASNEIANYFRSLGDDLYGSETVDNHPAELAKLGLADVEFPTPDKITLKDIEAFDSLAWITKDLDLPLLERVRTDVVSQLKAWQQQLFALMRDEQTMKEIVVAMPERLSDEETTKKACQRLRCDIALGIVGREEVKSRLPAHYVQLLEYMFQAKRNTIGLQKRLGDIVNEHKFDNQKEAIETYANAALHLMDILGQPAE